MDTDFVVTDFDFDSPDAVEDGDEHLYEAWIDRRAKTISWCGYIKASEDPLTGKLITKQFFCNDPGCHHCGQQIRQEMEIALQRHFDSDQSLRLLTITGDKEEINKQRAKLFRKYGGKEKCFATANDIPQPDGSHIVELEMLIITDDDIGEPYTEINEHDLYRWSEKSFYLKKSGNLLKCRKDEPKTEKPTGDDVVMINIQEFVYDTDKDELIKQIDWQTVAETPHLNPKTKDQLNSALMIRRTVRQRICEENGIVILDHVSSIRWIKMSDVRWVLPPGNQ